MWPIVEWYCCLALAERVILGAVAASFLATVPPVMPKDAFDALWLLFPGGGAARREAFLLIYQLGIATIDEGDPPLPVEVVVPTNTLAWILWLEFFTSDAALCLSGCEQSKPPYAT